MSERKRKLTPKVLRGLRNIRSKTSAELGGEGFSVLAGFHSAAESDVASALAWLDQFLDEHDPDLKVSKS